MTKITRQAKVQNPLISIVSGTWNRRPLLEHMMRSARETIPAGIPYEFVITDGGSTDGTLDWLRTADDVLDIAVPTLLDFDVTLIEEGELRGAVRAFTDAARLARGKYVILANDDIAFEKGSILSALSHLENHPHSGAVAFFDDRPVNSQKGYHILWQDARDYKGRSISVAYAQVGMFRRWLGDLVGWWGADDPDFKSRTYGGDNYLTSRILELGYAVDAVESARVHDFMHQDQLRKINGGSPEQGKNPDTDTYRARYPQGPLIAATPQVENPDRRQLRVLYMPIYEGGHEAARLHKRGLRNALANYFITVEYDYVATVSQFRDPKERQWAVVNELSDLVTRFQPDVLLTQIHDVDTITPQTIGVIRAYNPRMVVVNWNGDYWEQGLTSAPMLELLKGVDLQLVVNGSVLETYKQYGIPAAYWQCAYEDSAPYEGQVKAHDVVFMGNPYSTARKQLGAFLRSLDVNVGIYGRGWENADGETLYNFQLGEAIYQQAKVAVGDNQYPDAYGFVSNRIFQILGAGGALLLHQPIPGLEALTGIKEGVHYIAWDDLADLRDKIAYWSAKAQDTKRRKITKAAAKFIREQHSFDARVKELFRLMPMARRAPAGYISLEYKNARGQFGIVGPLTGLQYLYTPGSKFVVQARDAQALLRRDSNWFETSLPEGVSALHDAMRSV